MDMPDKGGIHILGWTQQESTRRTQHRAQFKMNEWFISGIFHSTYSDYHGPWVNKTMESETVDKEGISCIYLLVHQN